jgi:putative chitinase
MSLQNQIRLLQTRAGVTADGAIGPATIAAINAALDRAAPTPRAIPVATAVGWRHAMQARLGVPVDGIIGPGTYRALFRYMASGDVQGERIDALAGGAARRLPEFGIDANPNRLMEFFGETAHESGGWRWLEEIASGAAYEGRRDLGNTQAGDGRRFKGRGLIQLTGRDNYARAKRETGLPLIERPELAAEPENAVLCACLYWRWRDLNALADLSQSTRITRRINGGTNGLADRRERKAKMARLFR